jgi:hypothetical protein
MFKDSYEFNIRQSVLNVSDKFLSHNNCLNVVMLFSVNVRLIVEIGLSVRLFKSFTLWHVPKWFTTSVKAIPDSVSLQVRYE